MNIGSIERLMTFVGNTAAAKGDMSVWDKIDSDQAIDEYAESIGIPPKLINSADEVDPVRQQRAQAQQQAEMMQGAAAAVEGAKSLSQTNTTGDNALTRALGINGA
jgi:hypothetical protein